MTLSKRKENLLILIWSVSVVATLGSLFYSEILGYTPCELCWIQSIFMYPLVIIYSVALYKRDINIELQGLILSGVGLLISIYHYGLQKVRFMHDSAGLWGEVPCNLQYVNYFGFITIPFLAGIAFLLIFLISYILYKR